MAWGNFVLDKGMDCAAAITKFRCVKFSANETVTPVTAITDTIAGVAQFSVSAAEILKGKGSDTRMIGVTEAEASVAIAVGQRCTLETDGRVSAEVGASGKRIVGLCVGSPASTAGDRIAMLVLLGGGVA
jgi:hypothetical protein